MAGIGHRGFMGRNRSQPFHPTDLDVKVLLMANNPANFELGGSFVSEWYDLSGYNNYIDTATTLTRPTLSAGEVVFNGSQKLQTRYVDSNYITELANATETSQFVVYKTTNVTNVQEVINSKHSKDGIGYVADFRAQNSSFAAYHQLSPPILIQSPAINNTYYIAQTDWELAGTSPFRMFMDGVLTATITGATQQIGVNYEISVGARPRSLNRPFTGAIKAILIFNQKLNDSDRQKVEGWLAHELGMTANLPIGHPYKLMHP